MNNNVVIVIPCGAKKRTTKTQAGNLYVGPYFKANLKWAKSVVNDSNIFILSALHGLITIDKVIEPYDLAMGSKIAVSPLVVKHQAEVLIPKGALIYGLGGKHYLSCLYKAVGPFMAPAKGLSLGYAISIVTKNKGRLPKWEANYP